MQRRSSANSEWDYGKPSNPQDKNYSVLHLKQLHVGWGQCDIISEKILIDNPCHSIRVLPHSYKKV